MNDVEERFAERLQNWRENAHKVPSAAKLTPRSQMAKDLLDYQKREKEYWDLELENEQLKRKK